MTKQYELATDTKKDLILNMEKAASNDSASQAMQNQEASI